MLPGMAILIEKTLLPGTPCKKHAQLTVGDPEHAVSRWRIQEHSVLEF